MKKWGKMALKDLSLLPSKTSDLLELVLKVSSFLKIHPNMHPKISFFKLYL